MKKAYLFVFVVVVILVVAVSYVGLNGMSDASSEKIVKFSEFEGSAPALDKRISSVDFEEFQGQSSFYAEIIKQMMARLI